ncbi:hypothetical protein NDU88_008045 [Pleurodeles waltl]|uniref:Uncharacterized protein n=1 Tax=Pleurodeles waltl TaxID=8319 RepID=A0AAV7U1X9_PLEWA|nr:hypothetical protein NDU88_008045 [Pleurodeles waltl]
MASPPPTNRALPGGLQKETTPASIAAAAEAAPSPTQQQGPERPRRHLRTAPSLVGFRRRLSPASIAAAAEAAPSPTQQPSPERPPATSEQLPPWGASEGDYPLHPSQPQRRPLLLHSSQVLNGLVTTSEQLPPWWASEGDYPRIYRSRSGGRFFSYTAARS